MISKWFRLLLFHLIFTIFYFLWGPMRFHFVKMLLLLEWFGLFFPIIDNDTMNKLNIHKRTISFWKVTIWLGNLDLLMKAYWFYLFTLILHLICLEILIFFFFLKIWSTRKIGYGRGKTLGKYFVVHINRYINYCLWYELHILI